MKINMLCKTLLLAGLTAAMLTGCGKSGIPAETEVPAAAREQELSEANQRAALLHRADGSCAGRYGDGNCCGKNQCRRRRRSEK